LLFFIYKNKEVVLEGNLTICFKFINTMRCLLWGGGRGWGDSEVAEHLRMFARYEVTSEKWSLQFLKLRNDAKFLHPACELLFQN
jgi:hypothetical protein